MKIAVCYESDCGGETIATQAIIQALHKRPGIRAISQKLPPLIHAGSLRFFGWVFWSIGRWVVFLWKHRSVDWVYSTTYAAVIASLCIKPFCRYHVCFHFHGNRVPPLDNHTKGIHRMTQHVKHGYIYALHVIAFRFVSSVLVPSNSAKKALLRDFPLLHKRHVFIVPNGVNRMDYWQHTYQQRTALRKQYGFSEKQHIVTTVSRMEKEKNIDVMVHAFSILQQVLPQARLIIVYPPPVTSDQRAYYHHIRAIVQNKHLGLSVTFMTHLTSPADIYAISDVALSLSSYETFSLVILEALASGVPVLSTVTGAASTILPHIDKGLLIRSVSPASVAQRVYIILQWPEAKKQLIRRRMNAVVQQYTWDQCAAKIQKHFSSPG